jgi:hypothetical protein
MPTAATAADPNTFYIPNIFFIMLLYQIIFHSLKKPKKTSISALLRL